jgi:SET domain-containing protein
MALSKEKIAKRPRISNPYALGHLINHSKEYKNTTPISFDFDLTKIPQDLHPFIPNVLFSASSNTKIPSIIFVTLRRIQDEELLFDYNFKPDAGKELPSWYRTNM